MDRLNAGMLKAPERPVRVLQFGEGNFLRAFVDYMIDIANEKAGFNGSVVLVKPISFGNLDAFHEQDCRYTVMLRGLVDGKPVEMSRGITSVSDAVDAYGEYEKYAAYARLDTLRFIVSNTTEAGIVLDESDRFDLCPPNTYPGKLCKFLYERAEAFGYAADKGLIILPVELIDDNGIASGAASRRWPGCGSWESALKPGSTKLASLPPRWSTASSPAILATRRRPSGRNWAMRTGCW